MSDQEDYFEYDPVDETLDEIRDQRDNAADNDLFGAIEVNPQSFRNGKRLVIGPISFETSFTSTPVITFGQQPGRDQSGPLEPYGTADNYAPFLVQAYVSSFNVSSGSFDGFNIGLYALTTPPEGVTNHLVHWRATGKASVYSDQTTDESWTEAYDNNDADFLFEDAGDDEYFEEA